MKFVVKFGSVGEDEDENEKDELTSLTHLIYLVPLAPPTVPPHVDRSKHEATPILIGYRWPRTIFTTFTYIR